MRQFFSRLTTFFYSIRFRLVLWFTAILTIVLFAFSGFIYASQTRDIRGEALYRLDSRMSSIALAVSTGLVNVKDIPLQDADIFMLVSENGKVLLSHGVTTDQNAQMLATNAQQAILQNYEHHSNAVASWVEESGDDKVHYIFIAKPALIGNDKGIVMLGNPFDPYDLNRRLIATLLIGSLLTLLVALGGGWWLADRAMRPVHTITRTARQIGETDLNRRLNLKGKDELGQLADTFDNMLARLQTAFERQRQFTADASHELRTPLTIVNLETSRALKSKRTPAEYRRVLGVVHSENEFMTQLVNDLLTLARMDSGKAEFAKEPLDLSDIALEAAERLEAVAKSNQVKIEVKELPETSMQGDRRLLLQMVSNLIENGIKYTVGNDRRVAVETGSTQDQVWVRVSDNGPGIPPGHLAHLFDRFYQVDKARTRNSDDETPAGSGLGLAIVQSIAKAHNGEVRVDSEVGKGTTFEVWFKSK